jgi:hypothetical protein
MGSTGAVGEDEVTRLRAKLAEQEALLDIPVRELLRLIKGDGQRVAPKALPSARPDVPNPNPERAKRRADEQLRSVRIGRR